MTRIQDDLFATVNAEWLENAEIPADKPRISAFDELVLKNEKNLAKDLAELSQNLPTDNPELLEAIKFYNKAGDWQAREKADFSSVNSWMKRPCLLPVAVTAICGFHVSVLPKRL